MSDPHRDPHRRGSRDETDKDTQKAVAQLRWGEFLPEFLGNLKVVGNPMTMMMMMMNDNDDNRNNDNSLERERERRRERERKKTSYNDDYNSNKYLIVNLILVFIS